MNIRTKRGGKGTPGLSHSGHPYLCYMKKIRAPMERKAGYLSTGSPHIRTTRVRSWLRFRLS